MSYLDRLERWQASRRGLMRKAAQAVGLVGLAALHAALSGCDLEEEAPAAPPAAPEPAPAVERGGAAVEGTVARAEEAAQLYVCGVCGHVYDPAVGDPDRGIEPGTPFADLPDDWRCPRCSSPKARFSPQS